MKAKRINKKKFNRLVIVTIIAVYLLILVGGIVRSTGSGMGCPDWPKCFGNWVPPTSEAQLPANYQEVFAQVRVNKNHRLAGYLEVFGFKGLAEALRAENMAAPEASFNKYKTWTEYINRLLGVLVGILISVMAVASTGFRKKQPAIFYGSIAAFLLVVFQGWTGSIVVSTNLLPGMITFHMVLAALLICLLIYLFHQGTFEQFRVSNKTSIKPIRVVLIVSLILLFIQIAAGTQVREAIDLVALQLGQNGRDQWISNLGGTFYLHRSFSIVILATSGYLYILLKRTGHPALQSISNILLLFIIIEILLGVFMAYLGIPAWAQPLHLLAALLILGLQFWLYLKTKNLQRI